MNLSIASKICNSNTSLIANEQASATATQLLHRTLYLARRRSHFVLESRENLVKFPRNVRTAVNTVMQFRLVMSVDC